MVVPSDSTYVDIVTVVPDVLSKPDRRYQVAHGASGSIPEEEIAELINWEDGVLRLRLALAAKRKLTDVHR
jgi:hypothetical protein